jgi:hypothetical protein
MESFTDKQIKQLRLALKEVAKVDFEERKKLEQEKEQKKQEENKVKLDESKKKFKPVYSRVLYACKSLITEMINNEFDEEESISLYCYDNENFLWENAKEKLLEIKEKLDQDIKQLIDSLTPK